MKSTKYFLIALMALVGAKLYGQENANEILQMAERAYEEENYYTAAKHYHTLVRLFEGDGFESNKKEYPYEYVKPLELEADWDSITYIDHLEKLATSYRLYADHIPAEEAYRKLLDARPADSSTARFYYAKMLRFNENYELAMEQFEKVQQDSAAADTLLKRAEFEAECCRFAFEEMEHPRIIFIKKMAPGLVNTNGASNYAAVSPASEENDTNIIFTTTRQTIEDEEGSGHRFRNDLMRFTGSGLEEVEVKDLPSTTNIAAASITKDGNRLYAVTWPKDAKEEEYLIATSKKMPDGTWGRMTPLAESVNLPGAKNLYPSVTADGKKLYFSSDRSGGLGGLDIYRIKLDIDGMPKGQAENLGDSINTDKDERTPYFDQDSSSLYFSSDGHVGMGGLDVFTSKFEDSLWSEPENMGYPLNSPSDDTYPFPQYKDKNKGFLSSDRSKSCCYILFRYEKGYYHADGLVVEQGSSEPVPLATVKVTDSTTEEVLHNLETDSLGRFDFPLELNRTYVLIAQAEGYLDGRLDFETPMKIQESDTVELIIEMIPLRVGEATVLNNIHYDFDKATLRSESKKYLDHLLAELLKRPNLKVEISSHTDSIGTHEYNMDLSQRRSQSVVDYLTENGLPKKNIIPKGYGETLPIAPNTNPDGTDNEHGRQLNRRTEFKLLGEEAGEVEL